jgi:predicted metal-dependent hydrolase
MKMKYKLVRTWRKTLALHIKNGELIVRAPKLLPKYMINAFVKKNQNWIEKKQSEVPIKSELSEEKIIILKRKAKKYIPERAQLLAEKFSKQVNKIKITSAKNRWGSCTSKKNINFSYRLIQAEKQAIDYVIIHELAHLKYMNHSKHFWKHVEEMMPDYKKRDQWFKKEGKELN